MKLKITDFTDVEIIGNLTNHYENCTKQELLEGLMWYTDAQKFVFETHAIFENRIEGLTRYRVAATVSALSPNNRWERNKVDTITVLTAVAEGLSPDSVKVCTYNANKFKAFGCAQGSIEISAKSPKTHAFAMNVGLNSPEHITVDKWHIRACLTSPEQGVVDTVESCTPVQYRRIEALTAQVAHNLGMKGYEFQASVWVEIKRVWNR